MSDRTMRLTIFCLLFWENIFLGSTARTIRDAAFDPGSTSGCGMPGLAKGSDQPTQGQTLYQEGDVVKYVCSPQYLLLGSDTRVCSGGMWNGSVPICANRISMMNARQTTIHHSNASRALDGNYETCTHGRWIYSGYWYAMFENNKTSVAAVKITFPPGTKVNFSVRIITEHGNPISCGKKILEIGTETTLLISCPRNTVGKAISITDLTDQANIFQLCEVEAFTKENLTCRYPDKPLNSYSSAVFNSRRPLFRYQCKEGYQLIGPNETYCFSNGTWYPPSPICKAISCSRPPSIPNGNINYNPANLRATYNETVSYSCYQGFTLLGISVRRCLREDTWSGEQPTCLPVITTTQRATEINYKDKGCPSITGTVLNGHVEIIGDRAQLVCDNGYEAVKDLTSNCLDNRRWSTYLFRCKEVRCPVPPVIQHGRVIFSDDHKKLRIECQSGFVLNDKKFMHCQSSGEWINTDEICLEVACSEPPTIEGGSWMVSNQTDYKIGHQLSLVCLGGFSHSEENSSTTILCQENGTWSTTNHTCLVLRTEEMTQGEKMSSKLALFGSFLIGAATSIVVIGIIIFVVHRKKRRMTKIRSSQSIFHVAHPYFNTQQRIISRFSESAATDTSEYNEDDHIYQAAIYEEVRLPPNALESTLPKKPPVHLPLQAYYSQPFENKTMLVDDFHIYTEPVKERRNIASSSVESEFSSNNVYSEASSDNVYSYISDAENLSQQDSIYPNSSSPSIDSVTKASTLQMRENDLYETESEDEVFT